MSAGRLLPITLAVVGILCLLAIAAIVIAKIHRRRAGDKSRYLLSAYRNELLAIASDEDEEGEAKEVLNAVPMPIWERLRPSVIAFLPKVRGTAAEDLSELLRSRGEIKRATKMLTSRSGVGRARGAYLLGLVRNRDLAALLIPLLADRNADVRLVAARSLGVIGATPAADGILRALRTTRGRMGLPAWVAVDSLLGMGVEIAPAIELGLTSDDAAVRNVCAQVAGHGTIFSAAPQLSILLATATEAEVRVSAAMALGRVGGANEAVALARYTNSSEVAELRRTCAIALGDLGRQESMDTLVALLGDDDRRLAQLAADSLIQFGEVGSAKLATVAVGSSPSARAARGAIDLAKLRGQITADTSNS
ncbi:MAG: HEAT repeat domain-containing protein [Ilumatobacteraceae bacterium]